MEQAELNPCKCGCGELVAGTWKRGHARRGAGGGRLLPGPGDDLPPEEFGDIIDIGDVTPDPTPSGPPVTAVPGGPDYEPGPGDDEPPPHARREWRQKPGRKAPRGGRPSPSRITAGIRGDIDAKVRFALQVPGAIWQARDPLCGGVFVEQIPATAEAFTDIICDSADLVAFFTGPGGNFMKALKVGAALMPVAQVIMAHHVYHSVELAPEAGEQPDYRQYAA